MAQIRQAEDEEDLVVDELKPGTKLLQGQYTIERFINAGGFGITYLARNSLDREVVIKECFPGSFCRRTQNMVNARSRAHETQFSQIVKLFVQEAKSLSRLVHPNIIGVHQVFEDNDTAYMAIDYVNGRDLLEIIEKERETLTPKRIVSIVKKLLGAVAFIHDNGMLHRDISPDNILISETGEPILIDFGAARQQATKIGGKALSALRVVKDGYSPQEFYVSGSVQNASSDLYALAATFYHAITGNPPPASQLRLVAIAEGNDDPYEPLAGRFDDYPDAFLEAMDTAIRVLPKDRITGARDWLERISSKPELKVVPLKPEYGLSGTVATVSAAGAPIAEGEIATGPEKADDAFAKVPGAGASGGRKGIRFAAAVFMVAAVGIGALLSGPGDEPQARTEAVATFLPELPVEEAATSVTPIVEDPVVEVTPREVAPIVNEAETELEAAVGTDQPEITPEAADAATTDAPPAENTPVIAAPPETVSQPSEIGVAVEPETVAPDNAETAADEPAPVEAEVTEPEIAVAAEPETTPAPVAAPLVASLPEPIIDASIITQQMVSAIWEITLPFKIAPASAGGRFPMISEVVPLESSPPENAWVAEGAIIYAVDGSWVTDEKSIVAKLRWDGEYGTDRFIYAPTRIKADAGSPFQEVTLAATAANHLTLVNGVELMATAVDGVWQNEVTRVGEEIDGGLRVGDILVSEDQSGTNLNAGNHVFEQMLSRIAKSQWQQAVFTVIRDGEIMVANMPLARNK